MSQCHPCAINYDYIIKLETIYEDIQARFQQRESFRVLGTIMIELVTEFLLVTILKPCDKWTIVIKIVIGFLKLTFVINIIRPKVRHQHQKFFSSPTSFFSIGWTRKKYLMAILNRPDNTKELISQETISKNKNAELFKFYFNLLSPEALETLNRIHLDDLDIFNYSFDPIKKLIGGWD